MLENSLSEKSIHAFLSTQNKITDYFNRCAVTLYNSLEKVFYIETNASAGPDAAPSLLLSGDTTIEKMPLSMSCDGLRPGSEINPFWNDRFNEFTNPYAEKKNPLVRLIIIAALLYSTFAVLNTFGYIYKWSNGKVGKAHIAVTQEESTSLK